MARVLELLADAEWTPCRPFPRFRVDEALWRRLAEGLGAGEWSLLALWGADRAVTMALADEGEESVFLATLDCPEGSFPSVGARHAPAIRPERAVRDLAGLVPRGAPDARPWLDHGRWEVRAPLGDASPGAGPSGYAFLAVEGEGLHQIPVGPVHAGIIEPGHFRFTANGETVVRLEARLGYVHKGVEALMAGAPVGRAARLAARLSGDATVAVSLAFARAVEAALGVGPPERAVILRAIAAELERIANHLGDFGAICNDATFTRLHADCGILRERVLRAAKDLFGHRLMMDAVVPGGVAAVGDSASVEALVAHLEAAFPPLVALYDGTPSLLDRTVGTGRVAPALVRRFAAGGHVGRASGRGFDSRRSPGYAPYDRLAFRVPVREAGDVNARVWIRIEEVVESLSMLRQLLALLPPAGGLAVPLPEGTGEGVALAESFRGDVFVHVALDAGRVVRCHLRDPSWFQWPLLEAAIEGNIVADFPLCNKSFNCSYSGHDL